MIGAFLRFLVEPPSSRKPFRNNLLNLLTADAHFRTHQGRITLSMLSRLVNQQLDRDQMIPLPRQNSISSSSTPKSKRSTFLRDTVFSSFGHLRSVDGFSLETLWIDEQDPTGLDCCRDHVYAGDQVL